MRFLPAARVRLVGAFALHDVCMLAAYRSEYDSNGLLSIADRGDAISSTWQAGVLERTFNVMRQVARVSTKRRRSRPYCRPRAVIQSALFSESLVRVPVLQPLQPFGLLPKVFHNCGKHCGKSGSSHDSLLVFEEFLENARRESSPTAPARPSRRADVKDARGFAVKPQAKVVRCPVFPPGV
jgi:hypothetical protein